MGQGRLLLKNLNQTTGDADRVLGSPKDACSALACTINWNRPQGACARLPIRSAAPGQSRSLQSCGVSMQVHRLRLS